MLLAFTITGIFQGVFDVLSNLLNLLLSVFPLSPFTMLSQYTLNSTILQYLNYLLPLTAIALITEAWLACIAVYYVYMVIAKWIKLCGD